MSPVLWPVPPRSLSAERASTTIQSRGEIVMSSACATEGTSRMDAKAREARVFIETPISMTIAANQKKRVLTTLY
jgi:hypothetical protein